MNTVRVCVHRMCEGELMSLCVHSVFYGLPESFAPVWERMDSKEENILTSPQRGVKSGEMTRTECKSQESSQEFRSLSPDFRNSQETLEECWRNKSITSLLRTCECVFGACSHHLCWRCSACWVWWSPCCHGCWWLLLWTGTIAEVSSLTEQRLQKGSKTHNHYIQHRLRAKWLCNGFQNVGPRSKDANIAWTA